MAAKLPAQPEHRSCRIGVVAPRVGDEHIRQQRSRDRVGVTSIAPCDTGDEPGEIARKFGNVSAGYSGVVVMMSRRCES